MVYFLLFLLLFVLEFLYFKIAYHFNIIDKPNERSSHKQVTLRGGGILFFLSMLVYTLFFGMAYPYFLLGLSMIAIVSFVDDISSVSLKIRILIHFISMLLMFYQWGLFHLFPLWYLAIGLVFCTGIVNAYNFMDGINGITGGYSIVVVLTLLYLNVTGGMFVDNALLHTLLLALLVFCFFNFRKKAKCFAGDVGSVGLAFILLFVFGNLILKTGSLYWLVLLAVYGVDSVLTIIHRLMLHENIFIAHRKHAYQLLANELRVPHLWVAVLYMSLQFCINVGAVILFDTPYRWVYFLGVILLLSLVYCVFMKKYFKQV